MGSVLVGLVVAGCSSAAAPPVVPTPDASAAAVCDVLMDALPATVAGVGRTSNEAFVAQWGAPPIVLRCGIDKPAALTPDARCDVVNDVGWFSEQTSKGWRFTTIGRGAFVEVSVPMTYAPESRALVDLADAVALVPEVKPCV